jgi:hypothetical protein
LNSFSYYYYYYYYYYYKIFNLTKWYNLIFL